jgi:hypothetical protein
MCSYPSHHCLFLLDLAEDFAQSAACCCPPAGLLLLGFAESLPPLTLRRRFDTFEASVFCRKSAGSLQEVCPLHCRPAGTFAHSCPPAAAGPCRRPAPLTLRRRFDAFEVAFFCHHFAEGLPPISAALPHFLPQKSALG